MNATMNMNIHSVRRVRTDMPVRADIANAISIIVETNDGGGFDLTLFGLPFVAAKALHEALTRIGEIE